MHHFRSNHFDPNQNYCPIVVVEIAAAVHNHLVVVGIDKDKIQLDTVDIVAEGIVKVVVQDIPLHKHFVVEAVVALLPVVEEKTTTDSLNLEEEVEALVAAEANL